MYPYNYMEDDGGLSIALLAPMVIAVFIAKKLPQGIRYFLWKNYWWICAIILIWIGSNYTGNFFLLLLFGGIGAFGGLIGADGFNFNDFPDRDDSESAMNKKNAQKTMSKENEFFSNDDYKKSQTNHPLITGNKIDQPIDDKEEQAYPANQLTNNLSDSALRIISVQRKIYDEGIWKKEKEKENANHNNRIDMMESISGFTWKLDKSNGILWNEPTNEVLKSASGLGFSYAGSHLIIYNKIQPRKILLAEITEAKYKPN